MARNRAFAAYKKRMAISSAAYVAAILMASTLLPDDAPANLASIGLSLLPGLAVVGFIWAIGRLLIELDDEYVRLLEVRKVAVATGVTLAVCSIYGLLELYTTVEPLPVFFVFPLWCAGLGVGSLFNRLTMGDSGLDCQ